ncbi:MAG: hypothetical protein NC324_07690 [Bacteroides sp.]|nr:hypothetical protein [Bacteroides sp.]
MKNSHGARKWGKCVSCLVGFVASLATIAGLVISVCVFRQTQRIHEETQSLNENMQRTEYIRYARKSIEDYLAKEWLGYAVTETNRLNDSLQDWGMEKDSVCYWYLLDLYETMKVQGLEEAAAIIKGYLDRLR